MTAVVVAFLCMLILILARLPIAFAMLIVGFIGFAQFVGVSPSVAMVGQIAYDTALNYEFIVLPLFILMGNFTTRAGFSDELYAASNAFLGHRRGGLAMATVVASGGFAAISGSSLATAATMAKVALPPMRRFGYADSLATASIAAGGTIGIMIPPSVMMVIYGIITETNIGKLFIAGILPGLLGIIGYALAVQYTVYRRPEYGRPASYTPWKDRLLALKGVWGILLLFGLVIGGIYGGAFTTTEAAGIGAGGAFLLALMRRRLSVKSLMEILIDTARSTSMLFFILIGALIFANLVNIAGLPATLTAWINGMNVPPVIVIIIILMIYIILGCLLESISMILLTVPVFFPIVTGLGYDPVWFGIFVVMVVEIGLITPPVGLNVFVLSSVVPNLEASTVFRGLLPFIVSDFFRLALIVAVPALALWLPSLM